jgi:hypothetical protein
MRSRARRAIGTCVLLSAAWAGCAPSADAPDPRVIEEGARIARGISGRTAVVLDQPLPRGRAEQTLPAEIELVSPEPSQIERLRDSRTVIVPPALRVRLELLGYVLRPAPGAEGWMRVVDRLHCATVRTTSWSPLPGLEFSGRIGLELPPGAGGEIVLVVGDSGPMRLLADAADGAVVPLTVEPLQSAPGTDAPPADFWLDRGHPHAAAPEVVRVRVAAARDEPRLIGLRFGRRGPQVLARLTGYEGDAQARVCAAPLGGEEVVIASGTMTDVLVNRPELYGAGWDGQEGVEAGRARWIGQGATLLVPSRWLGPVHLAIEALPREVNGASSLQPLVNGTVLSAQPLVPGRRVYTWEIPPGAWTVGTNEITLRVPDRDGREPGLGVTAVRVGAPPLVPRVN